VIAGCAIWAFWPLGSTSVPVPEIDAAAAPRQVAVAPLDETAFRIPLWVTPPQPASAPTPSKEREPPPFRLQLLAIVPDGATWKALFYDPDTDTIVTAGEGSRIAGGNIERINPVGQDAGVLFTNGAATHRLVLREPAPAFEKHP
jgi:hypothetical protein